MNKKLLIGFMGALLLGSAAVRAEEPIFPYDSLTVGVTTPFDGKFSTSLWGSVASDLDVRTLIHGYDLVEWNSEKAAFELDPSVVSSVTVTENADGDRTYLLTLYNDLQYSDGTAITAWDYAFSTLLSIAPEVRAIGGSPKDAQYLLGYSSYIEGTASALQGVRVPGDYVLSFTISHAYLPFFFEQALLDCTPYPIGEIAPGCVVKDDGDGIYLANADESVKDPVFTADLLAKTLLSGETGYLAHPAVSGGPYRLVSFDGETVELERNAYYKGNSRGNRPAIEKLTVVTEDNETMMEDLAAGKVGLLNKVTSLQTLMDGMRLTSGSDLFAMSNYTRSGQSFISFSCEKDTVGRAAVRQAIAQCLDKDALVAGYVGNFGLRVDGYYGIGQWMYQLVNGSMGYPVTPPEDTADEEAQKEYEQALKEWQSLSLDGVTIYSQDVDAAVALLEADGWVQNAEGNPFDPAADAVRFREEDGVLVGLDLTMLVPEGNAIANFLEEAFVQPLAQAGIRLTVQCVPMSSLLDEYYSRTGRSADLIYLATNFDVLFDPAETFRPVEEGVQDIYNTSRIADEQLYELALDLRKTEPGDALTFCKKWVALQERYAQVLPAIPVYSNVYVDFYPRVLHDYDILSNVSWGQAIVDAYLGDYADAEPETEELAEGEMIFD